MRACVRARACACACACVCVCVYAKTWRVFKGVWKTWRHVYPRRWLPSGQIPNCGLCGTQNNHAAWVVVCAGWDSSPPCNCLHFWHTRSSASCYICAHAGQMLSTPAHAHGVISAQMLAHDKHGRSRASCHKCTHVADDKHSRSRPSCHKCAHAGT